MTVYCIGVLEINYDNFKRNHDILFTADRNYDIETVRQKIGTHYARTITSDLTSSADSDVSRFRGCHMPRVMTTSKETYDIAKKFTFELDLDSIKGKINEHTK